MTKHHDESMALAALFDCWRPMWRTVDGPHGFGTPANVALSSFGFDAGHPGVGFCIIKFGAKPYGLGLDSFVSGGSTQVAALLTVSELRSAGFIRVYRRTPPRHVILAAKSGLWWAVWDLGGKTGPFFHVSTAEYIPSKNRA